MGVVTGSTALAVENAALRAENERLREELAKAADDLDDWGGYVAAQNARAALEEKP